MTELENFDIGDKVKHPKFGAGTIVFRTGEGEKQKVTVKFGSDVGEKKLLVSLANLKLISERPTLAPVAAESPVEAEPGRARLGKHDPDEDEDDEDSDVLPDDDEDEDTDNDDVEDEEPLDDEDEE